MQNSQTAPPRTVRPLELLVTRRSLRALTPAERRTLIDAQVVATRPIVSGVIVSGAVILAMTGLFEATGTAPGIGHPWWVVELAAAAAAIAGCGLAAWPIPDWRPLTLLSTALLGVFMSISVPGESGQLAIRTGLFQLLPIALLALLARPLSIACLVAVMFGLAYLRVAMHGVPATGGALYWLYTCTTVGFGLLMGGYRTDYAVSSFHLRRRLWQQAITDPLTGLLNRAGWNREAGAAYALAVTRGLPVNARSSTSISSSPSTTPTATTSATKCCRRWDASCCSAPAKRATAPAWAARSSW